MHHPRPLNLQDWWQSLRGKISSKTTVIDPEAACLFQLLLAIAVNTCNLIDEGVLWF